MISPVQIELSRKKLEEERAVLMGELGKLKGGKDFGNDIDMAEEEDEVEELSNDIAKGQDVKERIAEIDSALSKIQNGTYGVCENCGKEIEGDELGLIPETRLCMACKLQQNK